MTVFESTVRLMYAYCYGEMSTMYYNNAFQLGISMQIADTGSLEHGLFSFYS